MSNYRYEVDETNAVRIWNAADAEDAAPFLFQPDWPDTTPWASEEEAREWATTYIEALDDPESEFLAGNSPAEPKRIRVAPTE